MQRDLAATQRQVETALSGDALAGFQRQVQTAQQRRQFWIQFATIPEVDLDTTVVANAWQQARDALLAANLHMSSNLAITHKTTTKSILDIQNLYANGHPPVHARALN